MNNRLYRFPTLVGYMYHYVIANHPIRAAQLLGEKQSNRDPYNTPEWYQAHYLNAGWDTIGRTVAMSGVVARYMIR